MLPKEINVNDDGQWPSQRSKLYVVITPQFLCEIQPESDPLSQALQLDFSLLRALVVNTTSSQNLTGIELCSWS